MESSTRPVVIIKGSKVLFAICMSTVLFIGWGEDRRSCLRQVGPRQDTIQRIQLTRNVFFSEANTDEKLAKVVKRPVATVLMQEASYLRTDAQQFTYPSVPDCSALIPSAH